MNPNLDRRRFLTGSAALAVPGLAGSWTASGCSPETPKRSLVIDHHVHVFPDQTGPLGYDDPDTHNRIMQGAVRSLWGRFVASHTDPKYIPEPDEEIGFTQGKYGIWRWRKHGEDCWIRRGPQTMGDPIHEPEQMLAHMDIVGVDMGVIQTGYMAKVWGREVYYANCIRRWPDRFIGTTDIDYDLTKDDRHLAVELETLERAVDELGYRGLCSHMPKGQPRDDLRADALWKACIRLKIPVFLETGFNSKADYLREIGEIENVCRRFPELQVVNAHQGSNVLPPSDPNHVDNPTEFFELFNLGNFHLEFGYVLAWENEAVWGARDSEFPYQSVVKVPRAPRPFLRPPDKARFGCIPGVCARIATQSAGMQGRSNAVATFATGCYPRHKEMIRRIYERFGARVMIWGADMPWAGRACTYKQCIDTIRHHTEFMTDEDRSLVLGGNAARIYRVVG